MNTTEVGLPPNTLAFWNAIAELDPTKKIGVTPQGRIVSRECDGGLFQKISGFFSYTDFSLKSFNNFAIQKIDITFKLVDWLAKHSENNSIETISALFSRALPNLVAYAKNHNSNDLLERLKIIGKEDMVMDCANHLGKQPTNRDLLFYHFLHAAVLAGYKPDCTLDYQLFARFNNQEADMKPIEMQLFITLAPIIDWSPWTKRKVMLITGDVLKNLTELQLRNLKISLNNHIIHAQNDTEPFQKLLDTAKNTNSDKGDVHV